MQKKKNNIKTNKKKKKKKNPRKRRVGKGLKFIPLLFKLDDYGTFWTLKI
jgi:hypothetical protein